MGSFALIIRKSSFTICISLHLSDLQVADYKGLQLVEESKLQSDDLSYRNLKLKLHGKANAHWWELLENCNDHFYEKILSQLPYADCKKNLVLYTFNEKLYSETWTLFIGQG